MNKHIVLKLSLVWGFSLLEKSVDLASKSASLSYRYFVLYSHSGGGQFVHCYVMFTGGKSVIRAVAANAGCYLWPNPARAYPYDVKRLKALALN